VVRINGELFGKGEVVVVEENFGVRMIEVENK
jgi:flagellar motor switch/type III secretory pathway protein FliN